jgi:hypothetical protein
MPIVAPHNRTYRSEGHVASGDWPEDCHVQWGGSGLVLTHTTGAYGTAFFEAFPAGGGFFRGEGPDIASAEADCLSRYTRFTGCAHLWGRGGYTNGGAICRHCKAFMVRFREITRLGALRDPISVIELETAMGGMCRPGPTDDAGARKRQRRRHLRLARAGIRLPDPDLSGPEDETYEAACREAVLTWYRKNRSRVQSDTSFGLAGLFDRFALRRLQAEAA